MAETHMYKITALSEALSPLTHNSGSEGNETLINREPIVTDRGLQYVPVLSGNAIRHRFIRATGAEDLIARYNLSGKLTLDQLHFLFNGGSLTRGSATENIARITTFWRLFPLGRVLGGCLPDLIVPGSLLSWRGTMICRENSSRLRRMLPEGWMPEGRLLSCHELASRYQYTRMDAARSRGDLLADQQEVGDSGQMIYSGEAVPAGAMFVHGWILRHAMPRDLGALLLALANWQAAGGTIGGMSSRGHGRLLTMIAIDPDVDQAETIEAYTSHADGVQDEAIAWLGKELGQPSTAKSKKGIKKEEDDGATS